jgi:hypothetical protein
MEIKIARCDPYPLIEPQGYAVGFIVYCNSNGKSMYRDVLVSFMELAKADVPLEGERNLILDLAFMKIKDAVQAWYNNICKSPVLLGSTYIPPSPAPKQDQAMPM